MKSPAIFGTLSAVICAHCCVSVMRVKSSITSLYPPFPLSFYFTWAGKFLHCLKWRLWRVLPCRVSFYLSSVFAYTLFLIFYFSCFFPIFSPSSYPSSVYLFTFSPLTISFTLRVSPFWRQPWSPVGFPWCCLPAFLKPYIRIFMYNEFITVLIDRFIFFLVNL